LKVTDALQLLPGVSVSLHSDVTANTGGDAVSLSMFTATPVFLLPTFLIVTVLDLLVVPTVTDPNDSEAGLMVSFGSGVGVAVDVGVAV